MVSAVARKKPYRKPRRPKHIRDGFAQRFIDARGNIGLTQTQLAERADVSRQSVSNWEGGKSYPNLGDNIQSIARVLGVRLAWLLRGEGEPYVNDADPTPGGASRSDDPED